jgi:hypothetical protein
MRKAAFILGVVLIAGSTIPVAAASQHHTRADRGHHRWDRTYDQSKPPSYATTNMREGTSDGKPPANVTQSCDRFWCYAD